MSRIESGNVNYLKSHQVEPEKIFYLMFGKKPTEVKDGTEIIKRISRYYNSYIFLKRRGKGEEINEVYFSEFKAFNDLTQNEAKKLSTKAKIDLHDALLAAKPYVQDDLSFIMSLDKHKHTEYATWNAIIASVPVYSRIVEKNNTYPGLTIRMKNNMQGNITLKPTK